MDDLISKHTALDALCDNCETVDSICAHYPCKRYLVIEHLPFAQPGWIPCSERLPEEDEDVLISYRYKEGEGDASHINVDITSYGRMYFGGNKVGDYKHWRSPFDYFESNYEVIAWMPLPEPYKEEADG